MITDTIIAQLTVNMVASCTLREKPVIDKSDLFILVVSASLLAVGIYRWQDNISLMSANAQQGQVQRVVPKSNAAVLSAISSSSAITQTTISAVTSLQTSTPVTISSPTPVSSIVVSSDSTATSVILNNTENNRPLYGSYIVVSGDYLSRIAQQYGTTVQTLQDINNIDGTLIEVGQKLQFPLPAN